VRRGFTLLETTIVLTLAALFLAIAAQRFSAARDRAGVRSALADLGGAFSLARQAAMTRGALVAVVLDTARDAVEVRAAGERIVRRELGAAYGIVLGSNRDSAVYDARGFGFGASNLSVTVRRGRIVDTLSMSRLGRVRW
jgi:prepilin-type N-terminal cleavage/methylation domain-containing protein